MSGHWPSHAEPPTAEYFEREAARKARWAFLDEPIRPVKTGKPGNKAHKFALHVTGGHCWYCGTVVIPWTALGTNCASRSARMKWATIDHVMPLSAGGSSRRENLVPACFDCNSRKASLTLAEWREVGPSDDEGLFWGEKR